MSNINEENSFMMTDPRDNKLNSSIYIETIKNNYSGTNIEDDNFFDISSSDESLEENTDEYDKNNNNSISNFFIDAILKAAEKKIQRTEIKQTQSNTSHNQIHNNNFQFNQDVTFSVFVNFVNEGIEKIGEIKQKTFDSYEKVTKEKIKIIKEIKEESIYKIEQVRNEIYSKIKSKTSNEIEKIIQSEIIRIETFQLDALNKIENTKNEALYKIQSIKQESLQIINDIKKETLTKIDRKNDFFDIDSSDEFLSDSESPENDFFIPKSIESLIVNNAEQKLAKVKKH